MVYYTKNKIDVESIRIYKEGTQEYIDCLVEDFKLYEGSLTNEFVPETEYYSSVSVGFINDSEELGEHKMIFIGDIDQERFRRISSFLSIANQRYRLEVTKNGNKYLRFFKRGKTKNEFVNFRQYNRYEKELLCESMWLKRSDIIYIDNRPDNPNAGAYDIGEYDMQEYANETLTENNSFSFTPDSEGIIFFALEATTTGEEIELIINGESIKTLIPFSEGQMFEYDNIPFYCSAKVSGNDIVPYISKAGKVFEAYFKPYEKNTITINGLKDLRFVYTTSFEVI